MHTFPFGIGLFSGWLALILKFVFIGVILAFVLGVLRIIFRPEKNSSFVDEGDDPLHILQMRLARGEISKEEYEKLKQVLQDE